MSKHTLYLRYLVLKELKAIDKQGFANEPLYGICLNVHSRIPSVQFSCKDVYDFIDDMSLGWPQHSGIVDYPIPSTDKKYNAQGYYDTRYKGSNRLWSGKQGRLRRDLIKFMIRKLKKMEMCDEPIDA